MKRAKTQEESTGLLDKVKLGEGEKLQNKERKKGERPQKNENP